MTLCAFDDGYASRSGFAIDPFDYASGFRIGLALAVLFRHEKTLFVQSLSIALWLFLLQKKMARFVVLRSEAANLNSGRGFRCNM